MRPTVATEQSTKLREISEKFVALGLFELTNNGRTYRVTSEGKEIFRILKESN